MTEKAKKRKPVKAAAVKSEEKLKKPSAKKVSEKKPKVQDLAKRTLAKKTGTVLPAEAPRKVEKKPVPKLESLAKPQAPPKEVVIKAAPQTPKAAVAETPKIIEKQPVRAEKQAPAPAAPQAVRTEPLRPPVPAKEPPKQEKPSTPVPIAAKVPEEAVVEKEIPPKILTVKLPIPVKDLAALMNIKVNQLIAYLLDRGTLATINQNLGEDLVKGVLANFGFEYQKEKIVKEKVSFDKEKEEKDTTPLVGRFPVVTLMGHVDHGKTSLLDCIKKSRLADKEKGGITQHIGAYMVETKGGAVTFLDTPGHEAFTAMRARGANATDIVVLVVAADDGVMPQTREAADHAKAAGVPIVVAINKCDLPNSNVDRVKRQLIDLGLISEELGGKTIMVPVSAKTGAGVQKLLEMLLLEAEMLELKANTKIRARGVVIEGKLSSDQGVVATVLVKNGTLKKGDCIVSGMHYGRIKAMFNDRLERVDVALPSMPVSVLGLSGVPIAGDEFFVVKDEQKAKTISILKQDEERERRLKGMQRITLEDFYRQSKEKGIKELRIILKADVQGSIGALQGSLESLSTKEVKVHLVHAGLGTISDSDILLAMATNAVIIGFNVKVDPKAEETAKKEEVDIKLYGIIYDAIADITAAMEGLLEPMLKEIFVGRAQVRQVFNVSKVGTVAGCAVTKGKIIRSGVAKVVRGKAVIFTGKIASLKRFKDDVREVNEGVECGIALQGFSEVKAGDAIDVFQIEKVARRLDAKSS